MPYGYYDSYGYDYYNDPYGYFETPKFNYYQQDVEDPQASPGAQIGGTLGELGGTYAATQTPGWLGMGGASAGAGAATGAGAVSTVAPSVAAPSMTLPSLAPMTAGASAPVASSSAALSAAPLSTVALPLAAGVGAAYLLHNYLKGKQRPKLKYNADEAIADGDYGERNPLRATLGKQVKGWESKSLEEKKAITDKANELGIYSAIKGEQEGDYTKATPGSSYLNWGQLMEKPRSMRAGMEDSRSWGEKREARTSAPTEDEINKAYWLKSDRKKELIDLLKSVS